MFDGPAPRVFTIPPGRGFAEAFCEGLLRRTDHKNPLALARATILTPTRRGARVLSDALVKAMGGGPVLAPRMLPLGDMEAWPGGAAAALPEAIAPMERLLALTKLVRGMAGAAPHLAQEAAAAALARDLAGLLDQAQGEGVPVESLAAAAPENHAEHWAQTAAFLEILAGAWPDYLKERGRMDPVARRAALIAARVEAWRWAAPEGPVIVAGSTGSVGISGDLIAAIARLPQGVVVLPGLDRALEPGAFADLREEHPDHPQAGLSRLLARIGGADGPVARDTVQDWAPAPRPEAQWRASLLSHALRPAPATDQWRAREKEIRTDAPRALADVKLIEADDPSEEAHAIALLMREAISRPDRTAALITPDRGLGRRVAAALAEWGVAPDDSSGRPLRLVPPGVFLSLLMEEGARGPGAGDPVRLLALLKHPLCALGRSRGAHLEQVREIEVRAMRGAAAGASIPALRAVFEAGEDAGDTLAWLDDLNVALAPLTAFSPHDEAPLAELVAALMRSAEALSRREEGEPEIWKQETGQAAYGFLNEVMESAPAFGALAPAGLPALLAGLMSGVNVRAPFGQHPRVFIWGTLEARMQSADLVILGGLNEDGWPKSPDPDPWMSRAMRKAAGLPEAERRIGLSSHDFCQAMGAQEVVLTRARKQGGAPTLASRWLQRLTTLLGNEAGKGFAPDTLAAMRSRGDVYRRWAKDRAIRAEGAPVERPEPKPPLTARPHVISATDVETLTRDPYALYARRVLRLYPLDGLAPEPDARVRGDLLHEILERFVKQTQIVWPPAEDSAALFAEITDEVLARVADWPAAHAFYRARAARIAPWFIREEAARREALQAPALLEGEGETLLEIPGYGAVTVKARADRIDLISGEGYAIYDYKTGKPPSRKQVEIGFAQQLPMEGAILTAGGFKLSRLPVRKLSYLRLSGGEKGGEEYEIDDADALTGQAFERLSALIGAYGDPERGYLSRARPQWIEYASDYDHLARVGEWKSDGGGEDA